ncbi:MAG TPA: sulfotransferase [Burkholderiales bacterium]|uniref:tetratricopeptide repeat-containing sulfotransferase family protein n=1 Tax=Sphingobium sp. TaxID=1912891 RepID=UPI002ED4F43F
MQQQPPIGASNMKNTDVRRDLLRVAQRCLEAGHLEDARASCASFTSRFPEIADGWLLSSIVALHLQNPHKAISLIDRALELTPRNQACRMQRACVLAELGNLDQADLVATSIDSQPPETTTVSEQLASFFSRRRAHAKAVRHYRYLVEQCPTIAKHWYNLAATERYLGNLEESEVAFTACIRLEPANYPAYYLRSGLRRQTPTANHISELEAVLATIPKTAGLPRAYACYALAKELQDLGDHGQSFAVLTEGARARRTQMTYSVENDTRTIDAIIETFSVELLQGSAERGNTTCEPIFVFGLPRSGTTLVERILTSHPAVHSAGELPNFAIELDRMTRSRTGVQKPSRVETIRLAGRLDMLELGSKYLESTRPDTGHTPRFVDKMPLNYLYGGLIAAALPKAKMIELVRHPHDVCYAIYKQMFTSAYPFSYDLTDIAAYYRAYLRLMRHWHTVLPGHIHRISYEALVREPERRIRELLSSCGLSFDEACLSFHENDAACTTASAPQVRSGVYSTSIGNWLRVESELEPLISRLRSDTNYQALMADYRAL